MKKFGKSEKQSKNEFHLFSTNPSPLSSQNGSNKEQMREAFYELIKEKYLNGEDPYIDYRYVDSLIWMKDKPKISGTFCDSDDDFFDE